MHRPSPLETPRRHPRRQVEQRLRDRHSDALDGRQLGPGVAVQRRERMSAVRVDGDDQLDPTWTESRQVVQRSGGEPGHRRVIDRELGDLALPFPRADAAGQHVNGRHRACPVTFGQPSLDHPFAGPEVERLLAAEDAELGDGERIDATVDLGVPHGTSGARGCHSRAARKRWVLRGP
jgi:hypothetical protein